MSEVMPDAIGIDELVCMLRNAAGLIRDNQDKLSRLDSQGGDGDHGTTMVRAMDRLEQAVDENAASSSIADLLQNVGWAIMGADGGATGPLFGSFFMSMSGGVGGETLDARSLATAFESALAGVQKNTRAKVGDKTMIDALAPAVVALRKAADNGDEITASLDRAAKAADQGARSTASMQARFGRAKNIGEKSIGHEDPGANSVSLLFKGFLQGVATDG